MKLGFPIQRVFGQTLRVHPNAIRWCFVSKSQLIDRSSQNLAIMSLKKNRQNGKRAIAYIRVSSQRQADEGVSIDAQRLSIKEYSKFKRMLLDEADILIEEGVSGGIPLWDRPVGRKLRRMLMTGKYDHIITFKLDRMFRLTHDTLETVDELADAGLALHIVDLQGEPVDTSSAMGRFFLTIMAALAEMERGLISERTQMGMDQLKKTHKKFTQSIFGWDVDASGGLKPNWIEQDVIDYMWWQVEINGMSLTQVARSLNKRGIQGKRGGKWQGSSVVRTFNNPFHKTRLQFPHPKERGSRPWHRK